METDQLGRLRDIREAARLITSYVAGTTELTFRGDRQKQDAVIRRIEIIGEAAACRQNWDEYNRVTGPIRARQEREEVAAFNAALHALPLRTIPKDRYEAISLEVLNAQHKCCFLEYTNAIEAPKHALFGKRFRMRGKLTYHPIDYDDKMEEYLSLETKDATNALNTWYLDVDAESLSREEREFIRAHCKFLFAFDECIGEFFGAIGRIERGEI